MLWFSNVEQEDGGRAARRLNIIAYMNANEQYGVLMNCVQLHAEYRRISANFQDESRWQLARTLRTQLQYLISLAPLLVRP